MRKRNNVGGDLERFNMADEEVVLLILALLLVLSRLQLQRRH